MIHLIPTQETRCCSEDLINHPQRRGDDLGHQVSHSSIQNHCYLLCSHICFSEVYLGKIIQTNCVNTFELH